MELILEILPEQTTENTTSEDQFKEILNGYYGQKQVIKNHTILGTNHVLYSEGKDKFIIAIFDEFLFAEPGKKLMPDSYNYLYFFSIKELIKNYKLNEKETHTIDRFLDKVSDSLSDSLNKNYGLNIFQRIHVSKGYLYPDLLMIFVQLHAHRKNILIHEKEIIFSYLYEKLHDLFSDMIRHKNRIETLLSQRSYLPDDITSLVETRLISYRQGLLKKLYSHELY